MIRISEVNMYFFLQNELSYRLATDIQSINHFLFPISFPLILFAVMLWADLICDRSHISMVSELKKFVHTYQPCISFLRRSKYVLRHQ